MSNGSDLFGNAGPLVPHLVKGPGGVKGEVFELRQEVAAALKPLVAMTVDEFTNPAAASVNSVKLSVASSVTAQVYTGAALTGATAGVLSPPRPVSVTCSNHPATWVGSITVKGLDVDGKALTETVALTNNATTTGVKCFAKVTEIDVPAQVDALGTFSVGHGAVIGLSKSVKTRAGLTAVATEIMDGAAIAPATGTVSLAATNPPHGAYTPAAAANGAHDYAITYEYVPLQPPERRQTFLVANAQGPLGTLGRFRFPRRGPFGHGGRTGLLGRGFGTGIREGQRGRVELVLFTCVQVLVLPGSLEEIVQDFLARFGVSRGPREGVVPEGLGAFSEKLHEEPG